MRWLLVLLLIFSFWSGLSLDWWIWVMLLIPLPFIILNFVYRDAILRKAEKRRANYKKRREAWHRRWYCKKCGQFSDFSIH